MRKELASYLSKNQSTKKYVDTMPPFQQGFRYQAQEALALICREEDCVDGHIKRKEGDEAVFAHMYNTLLACRMTLELVAWSYHLMSHGEQDAHEAHEQLKGVLTKKQGRTLVKQETRNFAEHVLHHIAERETAVKRRWIRERLDSTSKEK